MNSLNLDITFISENVFTVEIYLDVSCSIKNDPLVLDIYHKPKHSIYFLPCHS